MSHCFVVSVVTVMANDELHIYSGWTRACFYYSVVQSWPVYASGLQQIKSTESPKFCTITFSAGLIYLTVHLPESRDCRCYLSR